jgi:glutathione peroxidase
LETLWRKYRSAGLVVLAFPCNQFGAQEPGTSDEIARFCTMNYAVTFPILAKIDVNGPKAEPLYGYLKQERPGLFGSRAIKWNFTKFLVGRNGRVLARYSPRTTPTALERDVTAALGGG